MSLGEIRGKIDQIDDQIIDLLNQRLELVERLKPLKSSLVDKEREQEILSKIPSVLIQEIYQAIFLSSKKLLLRKEESITPS